MHAKQVKVFIDGGSHHLAVYCIDSWAAFLRRGYWHTAHKARKAQGIMNMKLSITSRSHALMIHILIHTRHINALCTVNGATVCGATVCGVFHVAIFT